MQARADGAFSPRVRAAITARAGGCCERCARGGNGFEIHHRSPRGMGGVDNDWTGLASNGLLLCRRCHRWVESNRVEALQHGWLVQDGDSPAAVPVLVHFARLVLLSDDGTYRPAVAAPVVELTPGRIATSW